MQKPQTRPLTDKQRRFVTEYLVDLNAKQAAIRAGYSRKSAAHIAYDMLRRSEPVMTAVKAAEEARAERTQIAADRVLKELARIAFADIRHFAADGPEGLSIRPLAQLSDDDAAAVAEIRGAGDAGGRPRLKLHDKRAALEMLARHLGLVGKRRDSTLPWQSPEPEIPAREMLRRKIMELAGRMAERREASGEMEGEGTEDGG